MLKDIIVNLAVGAKAILRWITRCQSPTCSAHITGMALALKPVIPNMVIEGVGANVIHSAINENEEKARSAIGRFETLGKNLGIGAEGVRVTETLVDAVERFATAARCYDLAIAAQAEPDKPGEQNLYIESALFTSGRPVLVVPYIQKSPAKFDRIVCCWDGGEPAARAIADAMRSWRKPKRSTS